MWWNFHINNDLEKHKSKIVEEILGGNTPNYVTL